MLVGLSGGINFLPVVSAAQGKLFLASKPREAQAGNGKNAEEEIFSFKSAQR